MNRYELRYLPIAQQDLLEIVEYIQNTLQNPIAAERTLSHIEAAILKRLEAPAAVAVWSLKRKREYPYRRINVGNYTVWYVVIGTVMEVRRVFYSRRNEETLL